MSELVVGQELIFQPYQRSVGNVNSCKVEKVGRKWITLTNGYRIDKETLVADGGRYSPPGCAWLSKKDYDDSIALTTAWLVFRTAVDRKHSVPEGVTLNQITNAHRSLFKATP